MLKIGMSSLEKDQTLKPRGANKREEIFNSAAIKKTKKIQAW